MVVFQEEWDVDKVRLDHHKGLIIEQEETKKRKREKKKKAHERADTLQIEVQHTL